MLRTHRLVITVNHLGTFVVETDYQNKLGYWSNLSRTVTDKFPHHIVERIAPHDDFAIIIRSLEGSR
jgi:hypothetical protein